MNDLDLQEIQGKLAEIDAEEELMPEKKVLPKIKKGLAKSSLSKIDNS